MWGLLAAMSLGIASGCDRPAPSPPPPAPKAGATSAPVAISPTTGPTTAASTEPTSCLFNINGHMTLFPAARLRLESDGQRLVALLFSDDPKDALRDNYTGNSFYLRFDLDVDSASQLADATWHYTAPSSGNSDSDSPYGIYLGGRKMQLQPYDFRGRFKCGDEGTELLMSGQFKILNDTAEHGGPAQMVPVTADVPVRVEGDLSGAESPS
jgi:hypothetical protein